MHLSADFEMSFDKVHLETSGDDDGEIMWTGNKIKNGTDKSVLVYKMLIEPVYTGFL